MGNVKDTIIQNSNVYR